MLKATASAASRANGRAAWSNRLRTLFDVRYLALASALATYGLIVLGGTVRATNSGLACPDWPRCHGQLIPPLETHVLIEWSHRMAAASVGVLIAGTAVAAWAWYRDNRFVMAGAGAALGMLILQVILGGVTVNMELPETVVALHLAVALVIAAVLVATAVGAFRQSSSAPAENGARPFSGSQPLMAATALATLGLIMVGSYVANSGAALVYPDWPLFDGKLVSAGGRLAQIHYAHRLIAVVVGVLIVALAAQTWRRWRQPVLLATAGLALVLYVAEVFLGASNIWFDLPAPVRVAHLALASAMWMTLVFGLVWSYAYRRQAFGGMD